ncbi:hypothetical protein BVY02_00965 [bacterium J17]|nr:hypothetical protein BVY02_00965 [bacterium J17]
MRLYWSQILGLKLVFVFFCGRNFLFSSIVSRSGYYKYVQRFVEYAISAQKVRFLARVTVNNTNPNISTKLKTYALTINTLIAFVVWLQAFSNKPFSPCLKYKQPILAI